MILLREDLQVNLERPVPVVATTTAAARGPARRKGGRSIAQARLGGDHPKALRLQDGAPISQRAGRTVESWFSYGDNHVFPGSEELIRFARFFGLRIIPTLALVLKGLWERQAAEIAGYKTNMGVSLEGILQQPGEQPQADTLRRAADEFNPNTDALLELLGQSGELASQADFDRTALQALVKEMIANRLHLLAIESPELADFEGRWNAERLLLKTGTPEEQEAHAVAKASWLLLHDEIADAYMLIEDRRLFNANVGNDYLAIFGKEEIAIQEAFVSSSDLRRRIALKQADPSLTREQLGPLVNRLEESERRELEKLRADAGFATWLAPTPAGGDPMLPEEHADMTRKCKRVLRQLRFALHPNFLEQHPAWAGLSAEHKEYLRTLGHRILAIRSSELAQPEGHVGHEHRLLPALLGALENVEAVLDCSGLTTDFRLRVRGDSLRQQLRWLEKEVRRLEGELQAARDELRALAENNDVRMKEAVLAAKEKHGTIREALQKQAEELRGEVDRLQADLERLFAPLPDPGAGKRRTARRQTDSATP